MKTLTKLFLLLVFLLPAEFGFCQNTEKIITNHSIALILKITSDKNNISAIETYKYSFFNGRIKDDYLQNSVSQVNCLNIRVESKNGDLIFDGYIDNPLLQKLESFSPDGKIERVDYEKKEDYINLRFHIPESTREINVTCFQLDAGKEKKMISNFKLDIK
jgi:hypothetical protein